MNFLVPLAFACLAQLPGIRGDQDPTRHPIGPIAPGDTWEGTGPLIRFTPWDWSEDKLQVLLVLGDAGAQDYVREQTPHDPLYPTRTGLASLLEDSPAATAFRGRMPQDFRDVFDRSWCVPRGDADSVRYRATDGAYLPTLTGADGALAYGPEAIGPATGRSQLDVDRFGPELALGTRMARETRSPLIVFCSTARGKTLADDWLTPASVKARDGAVGPCFEHSMSRLTEFLDELDAELAASGGLETFYGGAPGYELRGLVWVQPAASPLQGSEREGELLRELVESVRAADPRIPEDLPLVSGTSLGEEMEDQLELGWRLGGKLLSAGAMDGAPPEVQEPPNSHLRVCWSSPDTVSSPRPKDVTYSFTACRDDAREPRTLHLGHDHRNSEALAVPTIVELDVSLETIEIGLPAEGIRWVTELSLPPQRWAAVTLKIAPNGLRLLVNDNGNRRTAELKQTLPWDRPVELRIAGMRGEAAFIQRTGGVQVD